MVVNHPASSAVFIGRDSELAEIKRLLSDPLCRLLTLVGPGGIGKTRLAIESARQCALFDAVHFIPLQPLTSPDFIIPALADALNYKFFQGRDPKQQLLDYLREKSWLLVLDNFEHLLDRAPLLSEILAHAPGVRMLVTSRERLNLVEEWVLEVGGLAYPASENVADLERYSAVELFLHHARRAHVGFTLTAQHKPSVGRICRLLGGMPLGIELAAAWVHALSCEEIAWELEHSLDILKTSARNVEPRHRNMRVTFEPTWARLSDEEKAVFERLSVFRGGFTREAAEYVAGASLATLSGLVDKSLLLVDTDGHHDIHELLHQYAGEQLKASGGAEATRDAHSAYYAAFLQQKWALLKTHQQAVALDHIETEFENVRAAWQTMTEKCKTSELSTAVYTLWYFSELRGRYHEALSLFKQTEDALRLIPGDEHVERVIGQLLVLRGFLYVSLGRPGDGRALVDEGLAVLYRVGSVDDILLALDSLCITNLHLTDTLAALASKEAVEATKKITNQNDDRWLLARILFSLATYTCSLGNLGEAAQTGLESLQFEEQSGNMWLRASIVAGVLRNIVRGLDARTEAMRCDKQRFHLPEEIGQVCLIAASHFALGRIAFLMNDFSLAAYHFRQDLRILADIGGNTYMIIDALVYMAGLRLAQGNNDRAVELLAFVLSHPAHLQAERQEAEQTYRQLQSELSPLAFSGAEERGRRLDLRRVMQELLAELSQTTQAPLSTISDTISPSLTVVLTERELRILRLIADGLSNGEIADQLVLARSTVKWYVNKIFSKLNATSRTRAVAHARSLGLLT